MSESEISPAGEKLQKVLARIGMGSRRDIETWIQGGRVKVNGVVASLGQRVDLHDAIVVDGRLIQREEASESVRRVIIYNKPDGEICTRDDPEGRPTVFDRLPRAKEGRWINIGRLDINTTGLLMFTTDGELANRLMHPSYEMDREYAVRVRGEVDDEMLERLKTGVMLEDGPARFTDIKSAPSGEGYNHWYHCVVMEGRNREVRRLWESQGLEVSRLKRVRYGPVFLTSDLTMGRWREMSQREVDILSEEVGLTAVAQPSMTGKARDKLERMQRKSAKPVGHSARGARPAREEPASRGGERPGRARGGDSQEGAQRTPRAEGGEAPVRAPRSDAGERPVRAGKPADERRRSSSGERPPRVLRPAHDSAGDKPGERPARGGKDSAERPARTSRPEAGERPARGPRSEGSDRPARPARNDSTERPARPRKPAGRDERSKGTPLAERPRDVNKQRPAKPSAERPTDTGRSPRKPTGVPTQRRNPPASEGQRPGFGRKRP